MRRGSRRFVFLAAALLGLLGALAAGHLWAQWHYRQGQNALGRHDFVGARQHFTQSLKAWPTSTGVHLLAARAARKAGAFDDAERLLSRCRDLGGDDEAIYLERLLLRVQRGHLAGAEPQLVGRLSRGHPDSVLILEILTVAYLQTYQLGRAQECLRRWLEREPDRPEAWVLRAHVAQQLHNRDEALACYRRVLDLDPDNDDARLQMAGHLAQANEAEEALAHFERLRRKLGDTPAVLKGLACCRRLKNQPDEARRLLDAVLAEQPRDWRALAERGRLALQYESAAEAEPWLRRAAAAAPNESDVHYSLAQCLGQLGKHREAEEVLARLKRVEADLARMADLSRKIARTPHDPALRCEAGVILMRNGLEKEGLGWLATALEADPRHAPTHQALADYYARTGDAERAAEHRQLVAAAAAPVAPPGPGGTR